MSYLDMQAQHGRQSVKKININKTAIDGIKKDIIRRLKISHSPAYVNEISSKIDLIIEYSCEMGIEMQFCGVGNKVLDNIYKSRFNSLYE